jgi:hypothetical protein
MIPLRFPFTRDRYRHLLLERTGDICLVTRDNLETGSVHWEVVRLQIRPAETMPDGRAYPAREVYPGSSAWGTRGWTYTTRPEAEQKYRALASGLETEASAGSGTSPTPSPPPARASSIAGAG